ncbi:MAG: hypothetical protein PHT94_00635 [Candidatus Nanoarchaeia archaeon]|nr:hypothetical protein [Candidatus Nanoarchaeia archaeon]
MAKTLVSNAFSLNMISENNYGMSVETVTLEEIIKNSPKSVIGHKELADSLASSWEGFTFNRESVTLDMDDTLFVVQYSGPRLAEGSTTLPDGAKLKFLRITFIV